MLLIINYFVIPNAIGLLYGVCALARTEGNSCHSWSCSLCIVNIETGGLPPLGNSV